MRASLPIALGHELHQAAAGRVFVRGAPEGRTLIFGLVEFPRETAMESLTYARLNSHLWVDTDHQKRLEAVMPYPEDLRECDVSSVLTALKYAHHFLPDQFDVYLRQSFLPHASEFKQWSVVAGVAPGPMKACPVEGLYDLAAGGLQFTGIAQSESRFRGTTPSTILRMPLWGPGGQYGLASTMEPGAYRNWIDGERARSAARDPKFGRFLELMRERDADAMPMFYTAAEQAERDRVAKEVMVQLLAEEFDPPLAQHARPRQG